MLTMRLIDIEPFEKNIEGVDCFHSCVLHFTEFHHTHVNCAHLDTKDIPTVDAEPVRYGKWVKLGQQTYGGGRNYTHYCSECGKHGFDDYERCHGCGARMDGESE